MSKKLLLPPVLWQSHSIDMTHHRHAGHLIGRDAGFALGKAQRQTHPRRNLAVLAERPAQVDALTIYAWSNQGRLAALQPVRAKRMSVSPFTFFRGLPSLMLYDLAWEANSGLFQQICGDCHLLNFGGFASPERNLLFGMNDFDETLVAPFEWDLKRLVTSLMIAAAEIDQAQEIGVRAIEQMFEAYRLHLNEITEMSALQVWYESIDAADLLAHTEDDEVRKVRRKRLATAASRTTNSVLPKLTERDALSGRRQFVEEPPLLWHPRTGEPFHQQVDAFFARYRDSLKYDRQVLFDRYQCTDVALKVVGVGSVGTRSAVALFEDGDREPLILQMKEASASILSPLLRTPVPHEGQRVIQGQQLMQPASDIFLGYASHSQHHTPFYVRQLRDMKISADLELMDAEYLVEYAKSCGYALAHAHGKAGNADLVMGYLGEGDSALYGLTRYAIDYAARNQADYQQFMQKIEEGTIICADDDVF